MGKTGQDGTGLYDYYGTIAGVICGGPVDALQCVLIDDKDVWPGAAAYDSTLSYSEGAYVAHGGRTWQAITSVPSGADYAPPNESYWSLYALRRGSEDFVTVTIPEWGAMRLYWGTATQTQDPLLTATANDLDEEHPDYVGVCYLVLVNFLFGRGRTAAPNISVVVERPADQSVITGDASALDDGQANYFAAVAEMATSSRGLAQSATLLDAATWQAAADALQVARGRAAISPLLDSQTTLREFLQASGEMLDAWLRWHAEAALVEAGVWVHGEIPTSVHTLTADDLTERPQIDCGSWDDVATGVSVGFPDRERAWKDTSEKLDDLHAAAVVQEPRRQEVSADHLTRRSGASKLASEMLRRVARPSLSASVSVRRSKGLAILPGDWVLLDVDLEPGGAALLQYCRVLSRTVRRIGPIDFEMAGETTLAPIPWVSGQAIQEAVQETVPAITAFVAIETPPRLAANDDSVMLLPIRPSAKVVGATVWYHRTSGGEKLAIGNVTGFAAEVALDADISAADTSIVLMVGDQADLAKLDLQPGAEGAADDQLLLVLVQRHGATGEEPNYPDWTWDHYTYMEVASISAQELTAPGEYTATVLRGRCGTRALDFAAASCRAFVVSRLALVELTHGDFSGLRENSSTDAASPFGWLTLQPYTALSRLPLADATAHPFWFAPKRGRAPAFSLTTPATWTAVSLTGTYPLSLAVAGDWTDRDENLVHVQTILECDGVADVVLEDRALGPCGSAAVSISCLFPTPGNYRISFRGIDATGLETVIKLSVTCGSGTGKVTAPTVWVGDIELPTTAVGADPDVLGTLVGPISARCTTTGATIYWRRRMFAVGTQQWGWWSNWVEYVPGTWSGVGWSHSPTGIWLSLVAGAFQIELYATLDGYTDSDHRVLSGTLLTLNSSGAF